MKAILPKTDVSNARQPENKEQVEVKTLIAFKNGSFHEVVTVRWYMGRSSSASVVYCNVWIHGNNQWFSGKGSAGGYGYHKTSAAFQEALTSAGVKLVGSPYHGTEKTFTRSERQEDGTYKTITHKQDFKKECHIGGCGDTAIDDAMKAIAQALGYKKYHISRG